MSVASTLNSRASGDNSWDERYLWRGGQFLLLYVMLMIGLLAASIIWML